MKKILLAMAVAGMATGAMAQTAYNMNVRLNDGTVITYAADDVAEVTFAESNIPTEEFNILDEEHMPDADFRAFVQENIAGGAETYTNVQAAQYTDTLTIYWKGFLSLKGIEYFINVTAVNIASCWKLPEVDLSTLTKLTYLDARSCSALAQLTLPPTAPIEFLNISYTKLYGYDFTPYKATMKDLAFTSLRYEGDLDFSDWSKLVRLTTDANRITSLNVSGLSGLKYLSAARNANLTNLNVTGCSSLSYLAGTRTAVSAVDLTGCTSLDTVTFMEAALLPKLDIPNPEKVTLLNVAGTAITSLDLTQFTNLINLECHTTKLTSAPDFSQCTKLQRLRIENTGISTLDVTACPELYELDAYQNNLSTLNLSVHSKLKELRIDRNPLTEVIMPTSMPEAYYIAMYSTELKKVDLSCLGSMENLNYASLTSNPQLTEIKVASTFDIDNPPTSIRKDATARFVYEFSE